MKYEMDELRSVSKTYRHKKDTPVSLREVAEEAVLMVKVLKALIHVRLLPGKGSPCSKRVDLILKQARACGLTKKRKRRTE